MNGLRAISLHPWPVRVMHWINAAAIIAMIGSGWGIYNDSVIIPGVHFPHPIRLGTWASESLQWHFAVMWVLVLNGLAYLAYGLGTGRLRQRLLPIRGAEIVQTVRDTLRLHLAHEDIRTYNAVQKLLYIGVIAAVILQVLTGLAIWKPVQLAELTWLFGGFQTARLLHFLGMAAIAGFVAIHVALAVLVPRTLLAMVTGGPRL